MARKANSARAPTAAIQSPSAQSVIAFIAGSPTLPARPRNLECGTRLGSVKFAGSRARAHPDNPPDASQVVEIVCGKRFNRPLRDVSYSGKWNIVVEAIS